MKTITIFKRIIQAVTLIWLVSCKDDLDQPVRPVPTENSILQFDKDQLQIQENGAEQVVSLSLHKPASREGLLTIVLDTVSSRLKTDIPLVGRKMEVAIVRGQQKLTIKILPSDNRLVDGDMAIKLTVASVSQGFAIGSQKTLNVTILDDDKQEPVLSAVSFAYASAQILENAAEGYDVKIQFSNPLAGDGSFEIEISSVDAQYNLNYTTVPTAEGGRILIKPAIGSTNASIKIMPVNNSIISGDKSLTLSIGNTFGLIIKSGQASHQLLIKDDELLNLPKGYSTDGLLGQKRIFEYNESGRVSKVLTQSGTTSFTDTYYYDANGRIERINSSPEMNRIFTWTGNRITRSERIEFGVLKQYIEYDYDAKGNVSGTANYFRQPNGEFKLSFTVAYLYFTDNNLYKSMYYLPVNGKEEFALHSTRTYENYIDSENPFPMVDILPNIKTQNKLPGTFRLEENGEDLLYNLDYEFLEDGRVSKRYARKWYQVETTEYFYY